MSEEWEEVSTKKAFYEAPTKPPLCAIVIPKTIGRVRPGLSTLSEEEQSELELEFRPPTLGGISSLPETEDDPTVNKADSTDFGPYSEK